MKYLLAALAAVTLAPRGLRLGAFNFRHFQPGRGLLRVRDL